MGENFRKITPLDKDFPPLLKEIPGPPPALFIRGRLPDSSLPHVAVVGTRRATADGRLLAKRVAKDLASQGAVIVSGLALGIDAAAHEGALSVNGKTVAVLANGVERIYPRTNENLGKEIIARGGAVVSEYPPGSPSHAHQFLARNRIISGLSIATVIIEAPLRSGSLVTAKHALDQGREIFVAAGPTLHHNYAGSHLLVRQGARLIASADDIMEDLGLSPKKEETTPTDENDKIILDAINQADQPLSIDKIIELTKLETHIVSQHLTYLLFKGLVKEKKGKFYQL